MAISSVSDGNAAAASDLNQYKNALEGAATSTWLLKAATTTHFQIQLADNAGSYELKVLDSDGAAVARIDSNGNLTLSGSFSPSTLVLPTSSAPSQTAEGSIAFDTDDDVVTVGTGSATKKVSPYVAAGASPSVKGELTYDTTTKTMLIHDGTSAVPIGSWSKAAASDTTERSSATGSAADLSTITVSLATNAWIRITGQFRKTSGAAASSLLGLKLNSTQVLNNFTVTSGNNQAEYGMFEMLIAPYEASYPRGGHVIYNNHVAGLSNESAASYTVLSADRPNATITSVVITGNSGSASITFAVKNITVEYMLAT